MRNEKFRMALNAGKRAVLTLAMLWLGAAGEARASTINDISVEGWYGTGVNKAVLVLDFTAGNGTADSYAFGVNFGTTSTNTITGYQLLQTASSGTALALDFDSHNDPLYGWMVDEIWYTDPKTSQLYDIRSSWPTAWWSYWTSTDGTTWTSSDFGVSSRIVGNGDIDGWVVQAGDVWPGVAPASPMATPEPSTLVLLLAAGLAGLAWRRLRRIRR